MCSKTDHLYGDDDRALDYSVSVRVTLLRHDSTGLVSRLFTGDIDSSEWRCISWWRKHKAFDDMCRMRKALIKGGYPINCKGSRRRKCDTCEVG